MTDCHFFYVTINLYIDMLCCFIEVAQTKSFSKTGKNIFSTFEAWACEKNWKMYQKKDSF